MLWSLADFPEPLAGATSPEEGPAGSHAFQACPDGDGPASQSCFLVGLLAWDSKWLSSAWTSDGGNRVNWVRPRQDYHWVWLLGLEQDGPRAGQPAAFSPTLVGWAGSRSHPGFHASISPMGRGPRHQHQLLRRAYPPGSVLQDVSGIWQVYWVWTQVCGGPGPREAGPQLGSGAPLLPPSGPSLAPDFYTFPGGSATWMMTITWTPKACCSCCPPSHLARTSTWGGPAWTTPSRLLRGSREVEPWVLGRSGQGQLRVWRPQ